MGNNIIYIQVNNTIYSSNIAKNRKTLYRRLKNNIRIQLRYLYLNEQNIHMTCINAIIIVLPVTYCISNGVSFVQKGIRLHIGRHKSNTNYDESEYNFFFQVRVEFQTPDSWQTLGGINIYLYIYLPVQTNDSKIYFNTSF